VCQDAPDDQGSQAAGGGGELGRHGDRVPTGVPCELRSRWSSGVTAPIRWSVHVVAQQLLGMVFHHAGASCSGLESLLCALLLIHIVLCDSLPFVCCRVRCAGLWPRRIVCAMASSTGSSQTAGGPLCRCARRQAASSCCASWHFVHVTLDFADKVWWYVNILVHCQKVGSSIGGR
jgi:hypothetical protein